MGFLGPPAAILLLVVVVRCVQQVRLAVILASPRIKLVMRDLGVPVTASSSIMRDCANIVNTPVGSVAV